MTIKELNTLVHQYDFDTDVAPMLVFGPRRMDTREVIFGKNHHIQDDKVYFDVQYMIMDNEHFYQVWDMTELLDQLPADAECFAQVRQFNEKSGEEEKPAFFPITGLSGNNEDGIRFEIQFPEFRVLSDDLKPKHWVDQEPVKISEEDKIRIGTEYARNMPPQDLDGIF